MSKEELYKLKIKKLAEMEREAKRREELPHLYGYPWYQWAWDFFTSRDKMSLLTAANQVSKSSTQIRRVIEWATNKELWPSLWNTTPRQFWYLYPDSSFATSEFETKWVPEFLPRGDMKDDPICGWDIIYKQGKKVDYIQFRSGVRVYFKTYMQDVHSLQGSSVHYIACDEELPHELYSELYFRTAAVNGYFSMVFTATRAQEFWREAMEEVGSPTERFKGAWKKQVSLYESQYYMDGTASPWTSDRILEVIASCKDENEVLRRVYGRFVRSDSRRFVFTKEKNSRLNLEEVPKDWHILVGADPGNGRTNSKGALVFVAARPDFRYFRVFKAWRGDGEVTTAGDLYNKYLELRGERRPLVQTFDPAAVDFGIIAERNSETFQKADKGRSRGDEVLNTLFRYNMLEIDRGDMELEKLMNELLSLGVEDEEGDDLADALRYVMMSAPIDFTRVRDRIDKLEEKKVAELSELDKRRQNKVSDRIPDNSEEVEREMREWQAMYE